ncbi:hypothetical protein [Moraxella bovis]|uniref:Uncharacterized protein n=1 Tax=Moraxella bovis TaxID=476 RepID=A0A378PXJ3_MORBO|nr:hypothetical protein [Moraxella bovis]STY93229.1 Uncharacterised protein [Moraxella bovis]
MQPKSKTQEAYEFLQSYQGLTNPDNLQFHRWLRDGKNLVQTSAADGYILQGFAYNLLGNTILSLDSMKKAKLLNNYFGKVNYAGLLNRLGRYVGTKKVYLFALNYCNKTQWIVMYFQWH